MSNSSSEPARTRRSPQRDAVRAILNSRSGFISAQDLHTELQAHGSSVGLATVYRHLQAMLASGEIDSLHTGEGEALYRQCSPQHHHHLICRNCGKAVEIDAPEVETWAKRVAGKYGYTDFEHTVEVFGRCAECSAKIR